MAASSHAPRVLLVDDHDLFRTGLRSLLEEEELEVRDAPDGASSLLIAAGFTPDVVLMDLNMPRMPGIEATRRVLAAGHARAVVMLTVSDDDVHVIEAVRAGASGYLLKDACLGDIVAAIRAAAAGHSVVANRVAGGLLARVLDEEGSGAPAAPTAAPLTAREREVLAEIVDGRENREISRRLYMSESTVKSHVSAILEKLGAQNRVQAAVFAIRHDLV